MLPFCKRRGAAFRFLRITCSYLCFTFLLRALDWNNFEVNKYWLLTKCEVSEDPNVCLFGLRRSREIDERAKRAWLVSSRRERTNLVNKDFINAIKYTISSRTDQHWGGKMGRQPYEEKKETGLVRDAMEGSGISRRVGRGREKQNPNFTTLS